MKKIKIQNDVEILNNNIKKKHDTKIDKELINKEEIKKNLNNFNKKLSDEKKIIFDIPIDVTVELGKSKVKIRDLLNFSKGSMLFLNRKKEDPLKIFANKKLIALGEIVFSDNKYGIRIISINNSLNFINKTV